MKLFLAEMPSYTYAVRAKRLLRSAGISSDIRRRSTGCGYDLVFRSEAAFGLLDRYAVPYTRSGGAS